ncbi:hypothetical protein PHMEG_00024769, partial [Phytophthora megakarya]
MDIKALPRIRYGKARIRRWGKFVGIRNVCAYAEPDPQGNFKIMLDPGHSQDETVTIKEEDPLSTVQKESVLEEKVAPPAPTTPSSTSVSVIQDEPSRMSVVLDVSSPTSSLESGSQATQMNEAQAKVYVAGQVCQWEPLDEAWISDLQIVRSELPTAQDVTPIAIPMSMPSPRDCVALIQTLLVDTDFSFRNVIREWFRSRSSHIAQSAVRMAVEETEIIEWCQVAFGVTFQVVNIQDGPLTIQDYHAEDADGDLLMTDHEAGLLDKNGQSVVTLNESMSSIQHVSSRAGSDLVPSLFGKLGGSIESTRRDAVSQIKTEPGVANFQQDTRSRDADNVAVKKEKSSNEEAAVARADVLLAAQLQTTIQSVNAAKQRTKTPAAVSTAVKTEAGTKATKASVLKSSDDAKVKAKKATPKAFASKKVRRDGYPSDSDPSSEDDDNDSNSDDSGSSFCEPLSDIVVPKATQGGTTTMTI